MEIERKYLVTSNSYQQIAVARYRIQQGYISRDKTGIVRVRLCQKENLITGKSIEEQAFLTIKGKPADGHFARYEWEKTIDIAEAKELIKLCHGTLIDKTRWIVPAKENGLKWEVDAFHGKYEGLVVAEIELSSEEQIVEIPSFIGEEVTNDPRYYNANM